MSRSRRRAVRRRRPPARPTRSGWCRACGRDRPTVRPWGRRWRRSSRCARLRRPARRTPRACRCGGSGEVRRRRRWSAPHAGPARLCQAGRELPERPVRRRPPAGGVSGTAAWRPPGPFRRARGPHRGPAGARRASRGRAGPTRPASARRPRVRQPCTDVNTETAKPVRSEANNTYQTVLSDGHAVRITPSEIGLPASSGRDTSRASCTISRLLRAR